MERKDRRVANEIRSITHEQGLLTRAHGSSRYRQGNTCVLVSVCGPLAVKIRDEIPDRATVEVLFKSLSGQATHPDSELAWAVRQTLESVIISSLYPRTRISVVVQIINHDGAVLAAAINGAYLALLDAGIQCNAISTAVSVAIDSKQQILIDPTLREEEDAIATATMAFTNRSTGIVLSRTHGIISEDAYFAVTDICRRAASTVEAVFKVTLAKKTKRAQA